MELRTYVHVIGYHWGTLLCLSHTYVNLVLFLHLVNDRSYFLYIGTSPDRDLPDFPHD